MKTYLILFMVLLGLTTPLEAEGVEAATDADQSATTTADEKETTPAVQPDVASVIPATTLLPTGDALPDTTSMVTRMGFSLIAVIALIWGAVQLLKKFSPGGTSTSSNSHIRVLDRAYIAPKKSIYVVQIGGKALALGVSEQQITNLTDLNLEDTLAQYERGPSVPVSQKFTDVLKTVNARFSRHTEEPAT